MLVLVVISMIWCCFGFVESGGPNSNASCCAFLDLGMHVMVALCVWIWRKLKKKKGNKSRKGVLIFFFLIICLVLMNKIR